ncbi:AAA family ATPase [Agrococcus sp. SGAir0287]|uniref:AAA family ATPase n=1 Tax=Agrococcus sp. SGAir0287 TaxID=2070347 RepID=UPI0010CD3BBB|nr:AAA family ATPase [Agrococcus sp. SGAir0287]QCR20858.1 ATPase [Agrococcus sp. SGAir0287]
MTADTTSSRFVSTVVEYIRARHPILVVESQESERVVSLMSKVATAPELRQPRRVVAFTLTNGLHVPGESGNPSTVESALQQTTKTTEPTIFVFSDVHHQLGDGARPADPRVIRTLLDTAHAFRVGAVQHTLVITAPAVPLPIDLEKEATLVELPLPDASEIGRVLDDMIQANASAITVDLDAEGHQRLVQAAQGLTLGEAENAFARAIVNDRRLDASDVAVVLEEKSQTIRKSGLLELVRPEGGLDEVGGLENLKRWLAKRNGSWLGLAGEWGIPSPKGVLITGVPGCGKSLTAACIASAWELPLLRLDVGRVFSGLVGSSETNMRQALRLAEAVSPSILWIDEIEKGFGGQSGGGDSGTSTRVFGTFLTWMQEKRNTVFVIATANKIDGLPPEFLRKGRFDEVFFVDLPTIDERQAVWSLHLGRRLAAPSRAAGEVVADEITTRELADASEGFSGAEIAQCVIAACFDAFAERRAVTIDDLRRSIANTVPLSVTQAEQITAIRDWASTRAVSATQQLDRDEYASAAVDDVRGWRGGRQIDF